MNPENRFLSEIFGGNEYRRENVTGNESWIRLTLAHDAYYPKHIQEILENFPHEFSRSHYHGPEKRFLSDYVVKIRNSYVLLWEEEIELVGPDQEVNQIGGEVILKSKVAELPQFSPLPEIGNGISWKRIWLSYDSFWPGLMHPIMKKIKKIGEIKSSKQLEEETWRYLAKIGDGCFFRATSGEIDFVGNSDHVNKVSNIFKNEFGKIISGEKNFCEGESPNQSVFSNI